METLCSKCGISPAYPGSDRCGACYDRDQDRSIRIIKAHQDHNENVAQENNRFNAELAEIEADYQESMAKHALMVKHNLTSGWVIPKFRVTQEFLDSYQKFMVAEWSGAVGEVMKFVNLTKANTQLPFVYLTSDHFYMPVAVPLVILELMERL